MEENTEVAPASDKELLYKNMVDAAQTGFMQPLLGRDLHPEKRKELYLEQKNPHHREGKKVGRNDPCLLREGKKYKILLWQIRKKSNDFSD